MKHDITVQSSQQLLPEMLAVNHKSCLDPTSKANLIIERERSSCPQQWLVLLGSVPPPPPPLPEVKESAETETLLCHTKRGPAASADEGKTEATKFEQR